MKKINILILTVLIFISPLSNAQAIQIKGMPSCGNWISEREKSDNKPDYANRLWLLGYMSGIAAGTNKNFLPGTDSDSIYLWMDNYCKSHPLKNVSDGGLYLYFELLEQKGIN